MKRILILLLSFANCISGLRVEQCSEGAGGIIGDTSRGQSAIANLFFDLYTESGLRKPSLQVIVEDQDYESISGAAMLMLLYGAQLEESAVAEISLIDLAGNSIQGTKNIRMQNGTFILWENVNDIIAKILGIEVKSVPVPAVYSALIVGVHLEGEVGKQKNMGECSFIQVWKVAKPAKKAFHDNFHFINQLREEDKESHELACAAALKECPEYTLNNSEVFYIYRPSRWWGPSSSGAVFCALVAAIKETGVLKDIVVSCAFGSRENHECKDRLRNFAGIFALKTLSCLDEYLAYNFWNNHFDARDIYPAPVGMPLVKEFVCNQYGFRLYIQKSTTKTALDFVLESLPNKIDNSLIQEVVPLLGQIKKIRFDICGPVNEIKRHIQGKYKGSAQEEQANELCNALEDLQYLAISFFTQLTIPRILSLCTEPPSECIDNEYVKQTYSKQSLVRIMLPYHILN